MDTMTTKGPLVRVISAPRISYLPLDTSRDPELDSLWKECRKEAVEVLQRVSDHRAHTSPWPLDFVLGAPSQPILIRGGVSGGASLNPGVQPAKEGPQIGDSKVVDGRNYEYQLGPSGTPRWLRSKLDAEDAEKTRAEGGEKRGDDKQQLLKRERKEAIETITQEEKESLEKELKEAKFDTGREVAVPTKDGSTRKVTGDSIGGLIVHSEVKDGVKTWAVSHLGSGKQVIGGVDSEDAAKMSAFRLKDALDWEGKQDTLEVSPMYKEVLAFAADLKMNPFSKPPDRLARQGTGMSTKAKEGTERGELAKSYRAFPGMVDTVLDMPRYYQTTTDMGQLMLYCFLGIMGSVCDNMFVPEGRGSEGGEGGHLRLNREDVSEGVSFYVSTFFEERENAGSPVEIQELPYTGRDLVHLVDAHVWNKLCEGGLVLCKND